MHPRNPFQTPPNFRELALKYPDFRKHVTYDLSGKVRLDFRDREAQLALFRTLLKHYYSMDVDLPEDHLVPAIPQRLNYLLWVEDLIKLLPDVDEVVRGVDVGTGASCVLCLLGHKQCGWDFVATDVDDKSVTYAQSNVNRNQLQEHIQVIQVSTLCEAVTAGTRLAFSTCNPPFFATPEEAEAIDKATKEGRQPPGSDMGGTLQEKVWSPGGEVAFVKSLIKESLQLRDAIGIYTVMLGKKRSAKEVLAELNQQNIRCTSTEFCQGKTMRWGVAWTFFDISFSQVAPVRHPKARPPLEWTLPEGCRVPTTFARVCNLLREIEVPFEVVAAGNNMGHLWVQASKDTWSHQRRKRRQMKHQAEGAPPKKACLIESAEEQGSSTAAADDAPVTTLCPPTSEPVPPTEESVSLLSCDIRVRRSGSVVFLQLQTREGERESLHRLLQFLKNKLS